MGTAHHQVLSEVLEELGSEGIKRLISTPEVDFHDSFKDFNPRDVTHSNSSTHHDQFDTNTNEPALNKSPPRDPQGRAGRNKSMRVSIFRKILYHIKLSNLYLSLRHLLFKILFISLLLTSLSYLMELYFGLDILDCLNFILKYISIVIDYLHSVYMYLFEVDSEIP